ncbi:NADH dehydrogenase [ubiquinone] 1 beta subcomplex subunit 7-like [Uloborus diversus]|uniref:NADH dehydrogenase [ubiquinone] 1 beta subcomplex subunit 7-like n=1 Tax=Uloborus diversus TaxID=327109 RepID=UPI002409A14A|nr:NADH dehydrogenase [ubiquinone] 1 beta subcomplex subunit 7-like [Uloborus diversus]
MGNITSNQDFWIQPDLPPPEPVFEPKFDPMLGFPNGRKERIIKATKEEIESGAVPPSMRDYCVDYYLNFMACRRDHFPLVYKCKHEKHAWERCQHEDHVLRMKEYERERRLSEIAEKRNRE